MIRVPVVCAHTLRAVIVLGFLSPTVICFFLLLNIMIRSSLVCSIKKNHTQLKSNKALKPARTPLILNTQTG
jgi:hypothetical protein